MTQLVIGTRGSKLALAQTQLVADALRRAQPRLDVRIKTIATTGDRLPDTALAKIGDIGVFVKELETALLNREIDLAVHSAKDLPSQLPHGLTLAAFLARGDVRDALVVRDDSALTSGDALSALPHGARIGTGSLRRTCQLRALRPDLRIEDVRGNVDTRLRKLAEGQFDALVLAAAGLERLGLIARVADSVPITLSFDVGNDAALFAIPLPTSLMLPAVAQGTLAIESRADDARVNTFVGELNDPLTQTAALAERAFLAKLEGGCQVPLAAYAQITDGQLHIAGLVGSVDGAAIVRGEHTGSADTPERAGTQLAERLLADGALDILNGLNGYKFALARSSDLAECGGSGDPPRAVSPAPRLPLTGIRVIVTRAEGHNAGLASRLRMLGAEPIEYPVIAYVPPEDATALDMTMQRLAHGAYDWLVMTSATAVEAIATWLRANNIRRLPDVGIAVIGPATADACARLLTRSATLVPDIFTTQGLASAMSGMNVRGQHAVLLNADIATPTLQLALEDLGLHVERVVAYRTVAAPMNTNIDLSTLIAQGGVRAVTFTSGSTVRHFVGQLEANTRDTALALLAVCIGPTTAHAAREAGFASVIVAETATEDGLIEALIEASH